MRVALAGKGGAGKTTIAATIARLAGGLGFPVVAIDADSNPNLATALGIAPERAAQVPYLPGTLVSRRLGGPSLTEPIDAVLDRYAVAGPDGVRLALMGMPAHADEGCLCSAHATVSAVLSDLGSRPETVTVVDMEASPEHLSRGTARHVDVLLLVAEPYYRSLETTRRLAQLAGELPISQVAVVANKLRSASDADAVEEFCARHRLDVVAQLPWSEAVVDADRHRVPLVQRADGEVVAAISGLVGRLLKLTASPYGS
ncbi:MAG: cobyrinic acid a,c-diamide synthase [Actinomycetota bacterium]|nr:cobyrinic acid a,c-diamide synthase [Actinomycetota bacterium]